MADASGNAGLRKRVRVTRSQRAVGEEAGLPAGEPSLATAASAAQDAAANENPGDAQASSYAEQKRQYRKGPQTAAEAEACITTLIGLRNFRGLVKGEKIDILLVYFGVISAELKAQSQNKGRKKKRIDAVERTAEIMRRSPTTVKKLVDKWKEAALLPEQEQAAAIYQFLQGELVQENYQEHRMRIPQQSFPLVRDYIRTMRLNRARVASRHIVEFLVGQGKLEIARNAETNEFDRKAFASALRTVQRFLVKHKVRRGRKSGTLKIGEHQVMLRNKYLRELLANRNLPQSERRREVYLDESFLHEHKDRLELSLPDPADDLDIAPASAPASRRACFLAAIQGPSARSGQPAGLVPNSARVISSPAASDSHGSHNRNVFNGKAFGDWWKQQLLPNLSEPSLIILDGSGYHQSWPESTPRPTRMTKAAILKKLAELKVPFAESISVLEARALLKDWVTQNVEFEVVQSAREMGHEVLFTPRCYRDLQPIAQVWDHIKGSIGRQPIAASKLADVTARITTAMEKLASPQGSDVVKEAIESVDRLIEAFVQEMQQEEELIDQEAESQIEDGDVGDLPLAGGDEDDESDAE